MFTEQEIKIANSTSRSAGASAFNKDGTIRAVVPIFVEHNVNKNNRVLDFGAGKGAVHTKYLRSLGFNVTAYDFGNNCSSDHDANALLNKYDTVFASNVLNVSSSLGMLLTTLNQIYNALENGGEFICNYPTSPRKLSITPKDLKSIVEMKFGNCVELVAGTKSAPVWKINKK